MSELLDALLYLQPLPKRQPQQDMSAPEFKTVSEMHELMARETVVEDVDSFCEWLGSECSNKTADAEHALRRPDSLFNQDTPVVAHALLLSAQREDAASTLLAARLLLERYLADQQFRIAKLAAKYAVEE